MIILIVYSACRLATFYGAIGLKMGIEEAYNTVPDNGLKAFVHHFEPNDIFKKKIHK